MRRALVLVFACSGHAMPDGGVTPPSVDEIATACEVQYACNILVGGDKGASDCMRYYTKGLPGLRPEWVHCLATAGGDCDAARACMGRTLSMNAACPFGATCDGFRLRECGGGLQLDTDCPDQNIGSIPSAQCMTDGTGSGACSTTTCTAGTADRCDGTRTVQCKNGLEVVEDCAVVGDTCVLQNTAAECGGTGAACTADSTSGNTLVKCEYGFEHRIDCGAVIPGGSVQTPPGAPAYCGTGTACSPSNSADACNGTMLSVCAFGSIYSFDCAAHGFASCMVNRCM